jgi:hypothetical protein
MTTKKVQIHKPAPTLHLPAHENRAAARRRHNAALPGVPGSRPRRYRASEPRAIPTHLATNPLSHG